MKIRFFIILLMFSTSAHADDDKGKGAESQSTQKDDTIWIEEKVTPTTTWIENLVKPLTVWMEQQINAPDKENGNPKLRQENSQRNTIEDAPNSSQAGSDNILDPDLLIGSEKAGVLAKEHIAGDVLYIKLISKTKKYRVKLISKLGEIHIIYIQAITGEIISPNSNVLSRPNKQANSEQSNDNMERP